MVWVPLLLPIDFWKGAIDMIIAVKYFFGKKSRQCQVIIVVCIWTNSICFLNCKYDICSCLSQSENTTSKVLSVKTEVMRVYEGRAMKTYPRYLLVNLFQTIIKVWLWKMVVGHILSWGVYSCILFQRAAQGSWLFLNMADILTEVMHSNWLERHTYVINQS